MKKGDESGERETKRGETRERKRVSSSKERESCGEHNQKKEAGKERRKWGTQNQKSHALAPVMDRFQFNQSYIKCALICV